MKFMNKADATPAPAKRIPKKVNLAAKVNRRDRRWWMFCCARDNENASQLIQELFEQKFGAAPADFDEFRDDPKDWVD